MNIDINNEIKSIIENNKLNDLKEFLSKRKCLNSTNLYLMYIFHLIQSSGIILSAYAAGTNSENLIWVGISLNMLATLISIYEKQNSSILKKLLNDIKLIKDGTYIDEEELIENVEKKTNVQSQTFTDIV